MPRKAKPQLTDNGKEHDIPKRERKSRAEKTRNAGTMTEAQFWQMIRSALRSKTRFWKPILQKKNEGRRKYRGTNKRIKFENQCEACLEWFPLKELEIDHEIPAGSLNCKEDVGNWIERAFVEIEHLNRYCKACHLKKTNKERNKNN